MTEPVPAAIKERAIMVVKAERPGHNPEVLTYWSPSWRTLLFYNTTLRPGLSAFEKCVLSVGEVFQISPNRVQIDETLGRSLTVRKRSEDPVEVDLGTVEYRFTVQPIVIEGLPRTLLDDGHAVGRDGYDYQLKTIAMLKHDERTMQVNGKEVNFISREFGGNTLRLIQASSFA